VAAEFALRVSTGMFEMGCPVATRPMWRYGFFARDALEGRLEPLSLGALAYFQCLRYAYDLASVEGGSGEGHVVLIPTTPGETSGEC